jgi:predicted nucleic acid-binding protein
VNFWDSSAIVPLLVGEPMTAVVRDILSGDRQMHVWWGTEIECVSTIARLEREAIDPSIISAALDRLSAMREDWNEVNPGALVRDSARRLLRVHPLRAADALQLAAAWVLADQNPSSVSVVSLDERLRDSARREGFLLVPGRV